MPIVERRRQRLKGLHINRMIPNVLTLLALAAGLSALRFSLQERWEHSVLAILVAAVLDGLDGRIARILKGASRFGAELELAVRFSLLRSRPRVYPLSLGAGRRRTDRLGARPPPLHLLCAQAGPLQYRYRRG